MQTAKAKAEANGQKAKLASSYQQLLDEFSSKELGSVGNYTLGRLIGKGSFGKVYLATHKLTNGSKVVLKSANRTDSNLAREIHHHRQFIHPHIARLYEVIVTESLVWMVLEYCSGDELYNYLLDNGPLPMAKVQKIFAQLVGAVSYVHMQSCVHRDLKLENILFDKHENVKLVDFGFTREYEGRTNHLQTFCGTICYSAPEMLKGEKYAGEKVDVWSLGIILYALLCGELPFDDDDDNVTRSRILTEEPRFPDHVPTEAIPLIKLLLSKRPLLRPGLPEILAHPFLAEHAPAQQTILTTTAIPPFTTAIEKDCLSRMRSAGVDVDTVIESVLSRKCDALAGWWGLLLEKEQRKMRRKDRKKKDKEVEKSMRRLSAASSRLDRIPSALDNVDEDGGLTSQFIKLGDPSSSSRNSRGRAENRKTQQFGGDLVFSDMTSSSFGETYRRSLYGSDEPPPPPVDKDSIRSDSMTRNFRPIPPPKEGLVRSARSRGSTLHLVTTSDSFGLAAGPGGGPGFGGSESHPDHQSNGGLAKPKKRPSQTIIAHWKNWTHWFIENTTRRRRGHERRASRSVPDLHKKDEISKHSHEVSPRPQTSKYPVTGSESHGTAAPTRGLVVNGHLASKHHHPPQSNGGGGGGGSSSGAGYNSSPARSYTSGGGGGGLSASSTHQQPLRPRISTSHSYKRQSLSPSPITPRSTIRRSSAGLRGRESTSSSVSSVRSMHHHHHTHSKASSTSSIGSVSTTKTALARGQSPHHSVKVLPATPTYNQFPSNIRLVRAPVPQMNLYNEGMPSNHAQALGSPNPFSSGGVMFAKRKKNLFKGPTLTFGPSLGAGGVGGGGGGGGSGRASSSGSTGHSRSGSNSAMGRRSGEITIQEEEEDDSEEEAAAAAVVVHGMGEEDIEEVDAFTPVVGGPGEVIEEQILEDEGLTPTAAVQMHSMYSDAPRTPTQTRPYHRPFGTTLQHA